MFTRNLIASLYFMLALFGCDGGGNTTVTQVTSNSADTLFSKTSVKAGIARFECIRSASGRCHYTLFPSDQPSENFSLATGGRREVVGLFEFDVCVRADADPVAPDCTVGGERSTSKQSPHPAQQIAAALEACKARSRYSLYVALQPGAPPRMRNQGCLTPLGS